ncbi:MAG: hypothetical protein WC483_00200 [Candidatus Paceibacterota bacterium]
MTGRGKNHFLDVAGEREDRDADSPTHRLTDSPTHRPKKGRRRRRQRRRGRASLLITPSGDRPRALLPFR